MITDWFSLGDSLLFTLLVMITDPGSEFDPLLA